MNYKINWLNNSFEIENPTIEISGLNVGNPDVSDFNYITLKYSVYVLLIISDKVIFGFTLHNVEAESLDLRNELEKMPQQVLTALNEQFSV